MVFSKRLPTGTHKIDRALAPLAIEIDAVDYWPINPNEGDLGAIADSLDTFGQLKPIVVQKSSRRIVAGNHTHRSAVQLGWTHIAAVFVDIDDVTALAYAVADNRSRDRARTNDDVLLVVLKELMQHDRLSGTGYDEDDVQQVVDRMAENDALQQQAGSKDEIPERYAVVVYCDDEDKQGALLERLMEEGYECRALIS